MKIKLLYILIFIIISGASNLENDIKNLNFQLIQLERESQTSLNNADLLRELINKRIQILAEIERLVFQLENMN